MNHHGFFNRLADATKVAVLVLGLAATANTATAAAPTAAADDDRGSLEEVVITGTSIKRINAETALPVQVLKQEDIARTGASNAEELLRQVASVDSAGSRSATQ